MELPPFGTPQPDSTRQGPIVATTLVSILAVVLAGAFAPVLFVFGLVLNPFPLGIIPHDVQLSDAESNALRQTASERVWVVIILSILTLALVVTLAIILGRWAVGAAEAGATSVRERFYTTGEVGNGSTGG